MAPNSFVEAVPIIQPRCDGVVIKKYICKQERAGGGVEWQQGSRSKKKKDKEPKQRKEDLIWTRRSFAADQICRESPQNKDRLHLSWLIKSK